MSRWAWLVVGMVLGVVGLVGVGYLFVRLGGVAMGTEARPLPFERTLARLALQASYGNARALKNPLVLDEPHLLAGAHVYREHCAGCHGLPGSPPTDIARGMFPDPPQLFDPHSMVTDDPEGITYWKVTHGIRLSGMPGFRTTLSDQERWQATLLVSHADALSPAVRAELARR